MGLKTDRAHARAEVRDLVKDMGLLPSVESLDLKSQMNLILSELRLPRITLLDEAVGDNSSPRLVPRASPHFLRTKDF